MLPITICISNHIIRKPLSKSRCIGIVVRWFFFAVFGKRLNAKNIILLVLKCFYVLFSINLVLINRPAHNSGLAKAAIIFVRKFLKVSVRQPSPICRPTLASRLRFSYIKFKILNNSISIFIS